MTRRQAAKRGEGGAQQKREEDREAQLKVMSCAVCLELLHDPVSAPCGHSFCKACFEKWRTGTKANCDKCPTCREPLPETLKINLLQKQLTA